MSEDVILKDNMKSFPQNQIFLTDKNGVCKEKTDEISDIKFDQSKNLWFVRFTNTNRFYHYKPENVRIVKNCLSEVKSGNVYDYLLKVAAFSKIENPDGDNLLVKILERNSFVDETSALSLYLNPVKSNYERHTYEDCIFPFGCNNSQYKAVKTALKNRISIIQGPPGTGKTQTILNIIANLLVYGKTVLVVSNNNSATENIYEKLNNEKCGLSFLCAKLGKRENIDSFLENQQDSLPNTLSQWINLPDSFDEEKTIGEMTSDLKYYFDSREKIMTLKSMLSGLKTEEQYYIEQHYNEEYPVKNFEKWQSSHLMTVLQKMQIRMNKKGRLSFWFRLRLKKRYKIKAGQIFKIDDGRLLVTFKMHFYKNKQKEIKEEITNLDSFCKAFQPEKVYDFSMKYLKHKIAKKFLSSDFCQKHYNNALEIFTDMNSFTNRYPIVLSTTFSSKNCVGKGFLYDYVIMDEASQVDLVTGAIALSCAKNVVIVGDKMQLPNVISEKDKEPLLKILNQYSLPQGYSFLNSFLVSVETVLPETPQVLLREHYRCHPRIINFCNERFYGGKLIVMTEDHGETDVLSVVKTVPGDYCRSFYNQRQIDVIKKEILPGLDDETKSDMGIIAPYNRQVDEIRLQIPEAETATVHKFQGREKNTIIISTTDNVVGDFSDDANLLNVAVSRAKNHLVLVVSGNEQPSGSNIAALTDYIRYHNFEVKESRVCSIFDFLYTNYTEERFRVLKASKKISRYETENRMYNLLKEILNCERYSRFGVVFEMPLRDIVGRKFAMMLPDDLRVYSMNNETHVDFIVYESVTKAILFGIEVDGYNYHKKGTVQAKRDEKKNEIFKLIGLPLIRFGTRGSNEKETIITMLDEYC